MTFKEAIQALQSGDVLSFEYSNRIFNKRDVQSVVTRVVYPSPQTEEVEVKRWLCIACDRIYNHLPSTKTVSCACKDINGDEAVKPCVELTGTYTRPKPRKVVKEWVFEGGFDSIKLIQAGGPNVDARPNWIVNTSGTFTYRAEVEG